MNVIFKLDKPSNEKSLIMMVYRYDGKKLLLSTSISINTEHWNPNTQRVKEIKGYPEYITFNKTIEKYRLALLTVWDGFISKGERPTIVQLKESVLNNLIPDRSSSHEYPSNICKFIGKIINNLDDKNNETSKVYSQILKNFEKFPTGKSLEFKDLNLSRLESFKNYYRDTPRERTQKYYSRGTIYRHLKHLVTIINKAANYGICINPDYKKTSWRIDGPEDTISGNNVILNESEIAKLESTELNDRFDKIRDIFLLGLYTGQRYGDYATLSIDNVIAVNGKEYLQILQQKTKKLVKVPYGPKLKSIIMKYDGYPKTISLQKFNVGIKELCEHLEFNDPVIIYKDTPALYKDAKGTNKKIESNTYPKWQYVSTHTARRTFCTNAILKGVPSKIVMQMSGHKNIRTFNSYVRINMDTNINDDLLFQYFN